MMLFQVTYTMLPGQRDAFLQMMRESGILDQIRREEGCLDYRYYLPEEEDGTLLRMDCGDPEGTPGTGSEVSLWFDTSTHALSRGEISVDGFRAILCEFTDFAMS